MNWAEILEEKNKRIEELEAQLADQTTKPQYAKIAFEVERLIAAEELIAWIYNTLKPPIELTADNKLPAVRAVRERLGKYLEKK